MDGLSELQVRVLRLLGQGLTTREIAKACEIPLVHNELTRIGLVLKIRSRIGLMMYALEELEQPAAEIETAWLQYDRLSPELRGLLAEIVRVCLQGSHVADLADVCRTLQTRRHELFLADKSQPSDATSSSLTALWEVSSGQELSAALTEAAWALGLPLDVENSWLQLVRIAYLAQVWTLSNHA